jgi:Fur family iron response transcriptional regulator
MRRTDASTRSTKKERNGSMARPYTQIVERLKDAKLRPTRQRLALAKLLFENGDRHVTAEQLHADVLATGVKVSLATVYNTLHQFTESGLLREVVVDSGRSYFDTNTSNHYHFFHEGGGELEDIPAGELSLGTLPRVPEGKTIERVDVIIRVR